MNGFAIHIFGVVFSKSCGKIVDLEMPVVDLFGSTRQMTSCKNFSPMAQIEVTSL